MRQLLLLLFILPCLAAAQDPTRSVSERRIGQRTLVITGLLAGSDSAYAQIYHDGTEIFSEMVVSTFTFTLGTQDYYNIKFTDGQGRVKRIAIHELSDDMIEFYIPIEVDFDRLGNILLIKQSHGKPDWIEYDVGMSRPRKAR